MDHAETVATEEALKTGEKERITQQNTDPRLNQTEPCMTGQVRVDDSCSARCYFNLPF